MLTRQFGHIPGTGPGRSTPVYARSHAVIAAVEYRHRILRGLRSAVIDRQLPDPIRGARSLVAGTNGAPHEGQNNLADVDDAFCDQRTNWRLSTPILASVRLDRIIVGEREVDTRIYFFRRTALKSRPRILNTKRTTGATQKNGLQPERPLRDSRCAFIAP